MTTDERLALLAQRRQRPAVPAIATPGTTDATTAPAGERRPPAPQPGPVRRKTAAPLTRIVATGVSLTAVLAGAGFLALADRPASTPTSSQDAGVEPTAAAPAASAPITVVIVVRQVSATTTGPPAAPTTQPTAISPAVVPQTTSLGASAPAPAVTGTPTTRTVTPVTTTKKS
jgi:hypothetical protein